MGTGPHISSKAIWPMLSFSLPASIDLPSKIIGVKSFSTHRELPHLIPMDIPILPPPHGYPYSHSVPHSPYAYDHHPPPPPHHDIESAFRHAHSSLPRGYYDVPGYPPGVRPRSPRARSHSPFPPGFPHESDNYGGPESHYPSHQSTEENVRR